MNRGDIKLAYDRAIAYDVPDVADRLIEMAARIEALEAHNAVLREALEAVIRGCQSAYVIGDFKALKTIREVADDAIASTPEQSLSSIRRAERERCAAMAESPIGQKLSTLNGGHRQLAAAIRQMED